MTPVPKRRWFRFSLRTLFLVVTLVAVPLTWLGVEIKRLHEREAWRNNQSKTVMGWTGGSLRKMSWLRKQLGEMPMLWWELLDSAWTEKDREELQRLFPEAEVRLVDHFSDSED
jgi:hypothetical protein